MGFIHVYCGSGKGKTTAAAGLAIRAAGAGMKVNFVQLMKDGSSSEIKILEKISGINISHCNKNYGFFKNMSEASKKEIFICHNNLISEAFGENADMIVIDEFFSAYNYKLIDTSLADFLISKNKNSEIILTGRNPQQKFIDMADYVSEIIPVKHPFESGIRARKGIEY